MSISIFYKSYWKDYKLLKYSLESLKKNVTGYDTIVILIPENEKRLFDTRNLPDRTVIHYVKEYGDKYLLQQWFKISAHNYTSSDYILFADSDCIFDHEINLNDFTSDGKPEILYTDFSKVGDAICWKKPMEDFIKEPCQYEMMRRNCLIYHRETLLNIAKYEPNLERIIMSSGRFSEFNCMSAYAFKYEPEKYNFINTDNWNYTRPKAQQLWGWAEKNNPNEPHPLEYARSLKVINEVLGLNLTEL